MENIAYFGIDVHKDTNSLHLYYRSVLTDQIIDAEIGKIPASDYEYTAKAIRKALKDYELKDCKITAGYEAGPTGYGLADYLNKTDDIHCIVMAPTTIKRAVGERTKTDRRDAQMLAFSLATDAYREVHIIDEEDFNTRELTRCRNSRKHILKTMKQRLLSFLLQIGKSYPESGSYWTMKFWNWLNNLDLEKESLNYVLKAYIQDIKEMEDKITEIDAVIGEKCKEERYEENVGKLMCFTGIEQTTAISLCCEIGDFKRFESPEKFASFIGLVPGQDSSGLRTKYTGLTKTGNSRVRTLLVEATKGIKRASIYVKSKRLKARQSGKDPDVIAYANRCAKRIKSKMQKLEGNGKNANVATAAGARELSCFIWGIMTGNIA